MGRAILIAACTLVFALVGLGAVALVAAYERPATSRPLSSGDLMVFALVAPLLGAGLGLTVGCVAAYVGRKLT